ncbi:hypothetical protein [Paenibacillus sp. Marseille-Q4541]|uniref:hypothetical protein n=1 Tax=Paenibacillus sp. Marseille-Q4541 TaxID=2831522 RepID=UPI001BAB5527
MTKWLFDSRVTLYLQRFSSERFIAFGNNPVHSELAEQLGAEIADNKHVVADARSRMTSVENGYTFRTGCSRNG